MPQTILKMMDVNGLRASTHARASAVTKAGHSMFPTGPCLTHPPDQDDAPPTNAGIQDGVAHPQWQP